VSIVRTTTCEPPPFAPPAASIIPASIFPYPSGTGNTVSTRLLRLRLLHHFVTSTSASLPLAPDPAAVYLWSNTTPQMAFENDFVHFALLGTAVLHLRSLNPADESLLQLAVKYYDQALSSHRRALLQPDALAAAPLIVASLLLNLLTSLLTRALSHSKEFVLAIHYFGMAKGTTALIKAMSTWLQDSPILGYIKSLPAEHETDLNSLAVADFLAMHPLPVPRELRSDPLPHSSVDAATRTTSKTLLFVSQIGSTLDRDTLKVVRSHAMHDHLRSRDEAQGKASQKMKSATATLSYLLDGLDAKDPSYSIYQGYVNILNDTFAAMQNGEPMHFLRRRITSTPTKTSEQFIHLLGQQEPRAMAMNAHHFVLMKLVNNVWWLQGTAEYNFYGIANLVPPDYAWAMEWPSYVMQMLVYPTCNQRTAMAAQGRSVRSRAANTRCE
jgi:hypothetical protein